MRLNSGTALAFACALFCVGGLQANTWNALTDLRNDIAEGSPQSQYGQWVYGVSYTGSGGFAAMAQLNKGNCNGVSGDSCWQPPNNLITSGAPAIGARNAGSGTAISGTAIIPDNVIFEHPGPGANYNTIIQFTALTAGSYSINALYELLDTSPTGVTVTILDNASQLWTDTLTSPGATEGAAPAPGQTVNTPTLTTTLAAGDVLSFVLNNDGNFFDDSTGFNATITSSPLATVPEPASLFFLGVGLTGLAALRRRRNRVH